MDSTDTTAPPPVAPTPSDPDPPAADAWRRLLYRWFVQYNPLYLVSAMLVLAGCTLWSRGLVDAASVGDGVDVLEDLRVAGVYELYGVALLGGAALLLRLDLRRPAVMLALLAVVYQWDLTLHIETCAYLGTAGTIATGVWLALFAAKLAAFGWALRIRLAPPLVAAALLGAAGLALGPSVLSRGSTGALLAAWLFALGTLHRTCTGGGEGGITSRAPLDAWGQVVLARATRAVWTISGGLVAFHLFVAWRDHALPLDPSLFAAPLFLVPTRRREGVAWGLVVATLGFVGATHPDTFAITAALAAVALLLRALAPRWEVVPAPARVARGSAYRTAPAQETPGPSPMELSRVPVSSAERARLLSGAAVAVHLGLAAIGWERGPFPLPPLLLDAALAASLLLGFLVARARGAGTHLAPLVPVVGLVLRRVAASGIVPMPRGALAWGETTVALGFALLGGSLAVSYWLSRAQPRTRAPAIDEVYGGT
jgi:hypothetical protein